MNRPLLLTLLAGALASQGGPAMAVEEPEFQVVRRSGELEIREYGRTVVAETEVTGSHQGAGNDGFRRLAAYIFGKNKGEKKLAMTAPVAQTEGAKIAMTAPVAQVQSGEGGGRWLIQFMMPAGSTLEALPEPLDPAVRLRQLPARLVAAVRYSGTWSESNFAEHLALLQAALAREGLQAKSPPIWARYDPPFMPWFLRRNEILVELARE